VTNTSCLRDVVQIVDDRILTFDPDEKDRSKAFMERGFMPPGTKRYKDKRFMFDRVFDNEARQQDVYEATAQPLLQGLFNGYNATVFAYGVSIALSCTSVRLTVYRQLAVARPTQ
jgi:kinesin family protein 18/19